MKSTTNYTQPTSIIGLGAPGTGKTTFFCQFPKPFVLDVDNNLAGPLRWLRLHNRVPNVFYGNPYTDDKDIPLPRDKWYSRAAELLHEACTSPDVETIIIDSLTSFVDLAMVEVRRQQGRKLGDFSMSNKASKSFDEPLELRDWGAFFSLMKLYIFSLKGTGKTIIFTGHLRSEPDSISGIVRQSIACPGQMADVIAGFFSEVWLFESSVDPKTKEELRNLRTFPTSAQNQAIGLKSSSGIVSGEKLDPDKVLKLLFPDKK